MNQHITGVMVLAGKLTDNHGDSGLVLHNADSEQYVWNAGDPLGGLLIPTSSVTKVNGNLVSC